MSQPLEKGRERQALEIFLMVCDLDAGERDSSLERACVGDDALKRRVCELLEADVQASGDMSTFRSDVKNVARALGRASAWSAEASRVETRRPGTILSHYQILDSIGRGGMGEVYRAFDRTLEREVALKVLPEQLASHPRRLERFEQEARTLAALNHANIVTIYSVETADGVPFLTMELVEGKTLHALIPDSGLPAARFRTLALALTDALVAAHARGIIHRDLKPANVMVTGTGQLKVLDFGLAKQGAAAPRGPGPRRVDQAASAEAPLMGTLPYMSPEQIRGEPIDERSDLFSLGVALYEMATGRRPFAGDMQGELIASILRHAPPPVSKLRPELPVRLDEVLGRCLDKQAGRRYASAIELREELARLLESAPDRVPSHSEDEPPSIAVLPFSNLNRDPEDEFFSDGLTEELGNELTRLGGLRVAARMSAIRFKERTEARRKRAASWASATCSKAASAGSAAVSGSRRG